METNEYQLKIDKLLAERRIAREFQERRHMDWNENYELYRNKVKTNRLTQRQAVNIPLMKETVKTILSRIDDAPNIDWKEKSGDEYKELVYQEIWDDQFKKKKYEWVDVLDKKNVLLYGLSTKMLNLDKTGIKISVLDPFDVVYDPLMNPADVETARFIVRQNIFRSVREVLADSRYSEEGKEKIKQWSLQKDGILQSEKNKEELERKQKRLASMGVDSDEFSRFSGGDLILNICEHFTNEWDNKKQKFVRRVVTYAQDKIELLDEPLKELLGVEFWPLIVWSEDLEPNDVYPDGIADLVRTPNKIMNIWFSQQVENRTLQNFQMHWFDSTKEGYQPQTYDPGPGRMLPAPGNPSETIMPVQINGLDESFTAIDFLIKMVERGSGATAIEKGVSERSQITLGEVQLLVGKAMERVTSISKFYRGAWYELAVKWDALMHANAPKIIELTKANKAGVLFPKSAYPSDWKSTFGYEPVVSSSSEREEGTVKGIQKWQVIMGMFPNNPVIRKLAAKRSLELVDLTPQELKEVEEAEEEAQRMMMQQPQQPVQPEIPQLKTEGI